MRWAVTGGAPALRPAATRATDHAVALGADPDRSDLIEVAVHELLVNALAHGNGGDHRLPIGLRVARPDGRAVTVAVTDRAVHGPWEGPPRRPTAAAVTSSSGRGWQLIRAVATAAHTCRVAGGGTVVLIELPTVHAVSGTRR